MMIKPHCHKQQTEWLAGNLASSLLFSNQSLATVGLPAERKRKRRRTRTRTRMRDNDRGNVSWTTDEPLTCGSLSCQSADALLSLASGETSWWCAIRPSSQLTRQVCDLECSTCVQKAWPEKQPLKSSRGEQEEEDKKKKKWKRTKKKSMMTPPSSERHSPFVSTATND